MGGSWGQSPGAKSVPRAGSQVSQQPWPCLLSHRAPWALEACTGRRTELAPESALREWAHPPLGVHGQRRAEGPGFRAEP